MKKTFLTALIALMSLITLVPAQAQQQVRIGGPGHVYSGLGAGWCGESAFMAGSDGCLLRVGPGQYGFSSNGALPVASLLQISPNIFLNAPAAAGLATSTSGGTIAAGTYRVAVTYVLPTGGETTISTDSSSTQATTGTTSNLTVTAPAAASDALGYRVYISAAAGAASSEVLQPLSTAVCAGMLTAGGGISVCPFGTNAVFTSLVSSGLAIPGANTAGVVNLTAGPQTAVTAVTTAQTMASWALAAGAMNVQGKTMQVCGSGVYTSAGTTTPTMTFSAKVGSSVTPVSITSAATSSTASTNAPFSFCFNIQTTLVGASGTDEAHGRLDLNIAAGSPAAAIASYLDTNTAASSAYDHTAANTLALNVAASAAITSITLREARVTFIQN